MDIKQFAELLNNREIGKEIYEKNEWEVKLWV